ncbi:nucleotide-binding domain-containing protein [Aspergillus heteromorphus CBS 117.55]|uniref:Nucleotide-binding domain-containing protein n=1 Tax=Aspergillus heteromorphus CBS 117.55 TaxID=1448321 RepID=A0A317VF90_9EURO|nr:nucleotide-binding domain-containing protein [Aspergillus heteromorphus CBS 117.55]PWY73046.1 nucleotide-binding domain-containing protein [Aspergillus heteromorphus CBS 117.55]
MNVGIIGAGVIGLSAAEALVEAGYTVTIVARDLPGDDTSVQWSSPWAGAAVMPHPDAPGQDLQTETFKYYWALAHRDPTSGVQVVDITEYYDDRDGDSTIWYKQLAPKYRRIPADQLPAGATLGFKYQSMTANPTYYLPWLKKRLDARGVRFIRAAVSSIAEARQVTGALVIVNASGLGALDLAGDADVVPVRGQTMLVQSDSHEVTMFQGSHYSYAIPRMYTGGIIIGGVAQEGRSDEAVDPETRQDILRRVRSVAPGRFDSTDLNVDVMKDCVAFRPGRKGGYRLERDGEVIHAYGFRGLGYVFNYGVGMRVREMVEEIEGQGPRSRL